MTYVIQKDVEGTSPSTGKKSIIKKGTRLHEQPQNRGTDYSGNPKVILKTQDGLVFYVKKQDLEMKDESNITEQYLSGVVTKSRLVAETVENKMLFKDLNPGDHFKLNSTDTFHVLWTKTKDGKALKADERTPDTDSVHSIEPNRVVIQILGDNSPFAKLLKGKIDEEAFQDEDKLTNLIFKLTNAFKHASDPDSDFDATQLKAGMEVEAEHSDLPEVQKAIAKAHLVEDPEYYIKLAKAGL